MLSSYVENRFAEDIKNNRSADSALVKKNFLLVVDPGRRPR